MAYATEREKALVNKQMCHGASTSDKYYAMIQSNKETAEAHRILNRDREPSNQKAKNPTRRSFTGAETQALSKYFKKHISDKKGTTPAEARAFLEVHQEVKRNHKQIQDKVRNLISSHHSSESEEDN